MSRRKWSDEDFIQAVKGSKSIAETLSILGLAPKGGNYSTFRRHVKRLGLSTEHFQGLAWNSGNRGQETPSYIPASSYLGIDGRPIQSCRLKHKLWIEGLLPECCALCGLETIWNGSPIVLQLDHINGNKHDNRLENLRILCPNCHTQQATSSGKRRYSHVQICNPKHTTVCKTCNVPVSARATYCNKCRPRTSKIQWPSNDELMRLVWEQPRTVISKTLGVSDVAISKHCRKNSIQMPPRGYWAKKRNGCDVSFLLPPELRY